jgi:hypothetical protein
MKKALKQIGLLFILAAMIFNCGGQQKMASVSAGDIPDWFAKLPQDPNYLFSANTAVSQDLQ